MKVDRKDDSVTLSWFEPENNGAAIIWYSIYTRIGSDVEWKKVAYLKVEEGFKLEYTLTLERGKNYELMVTATNEFGESAMNEDNIQTVEVPNLGEQRVESSKIIEGCHIHCIVLTMMKDHHTCKCKLPVFLSHCGICRNLGLVLHEYYMYVTHICNIYFAEVHVKRSVI